MVQVKGVINSDVYNQLKVKVNSIYKVLNVYPSFFAQAAKEELSCIALGIELISGIKSDEITRLFNYITCDMSYEEFIWWLKDNSPAEDPREEFTRWLKDNCPAEDKKIL